MARRMREEERTKKKKLNLLSLSISLVSLSFCASPDKTFYTGSLFFTNTLTVQLNPSFFISNLPLKAAAEKLKLPLRRQRPPPLTAAALLRPRRRCSRKRLRGPLSDERRPLKGAQVAQAVIYLEPATR